MAGGKGTRMNIQEEKLLLKYKKPIILHVLDALRESNCFSTIIAATSPNSPNTHNLLSNYGIQIIRTMGKGYVSDLSSALSQLNDSVFVVSGDLPLLDGMMIRELISKYQKESTWQSFMVTKKFLELLNLTLEFSVMINDMECYYTGISIVTPNKITDDVLETYTIVDDKKIAFNLNTKNDYDLLKNT